jgi:hypothetical protein
MQELRKIACKYEHKYTEKMSRRSQKLAAINLAETLLFTFPHMNYICRYFLVYCYTVHK